LEQNERAICMPSRAGREQDMAFDRCGKQRDAQCIKIDVHFASVPWSEVMKSVGEGQLDLAISNITYKPEREDKFGILFGTESYETTGHAFVSRPSKSGKIDPGPDARGPATVLTGKTVAVQADTTSDDCLRILQEKQEKEARPAPPGRLAGETESAHFKIVKRSRSVLAVTMLLRNRANFDYVLTDGSIAEGWKALHGDDLVLTPAEPDFFGADAPRYCRSQEYRIAVKGAEFDLQQLTDTVLKNLKSSGELARINERAIEEFASFVHKREQARQILTAEESSDSSH
jgi:ABC-type amino acid transport substrate-binding protein